MTNVPFPAVFPDPATGQIKGSAELRHFPLPQRSSKASQWNKWSNQSIRGFSSDAVHGSQTRVRFHLIGPTVMTRPIQRNGPMRDQAFLGLQTSQLYELFVQSTWWILPHGLNYASLPDTQLLSWVFSSTNYFLRLLRGRTFKEPSTWEVTTHCHQNNKIWCFRWMWQKDTTQSPGWPKIWTSIANCNHHCSYNSIRRQFQIGFVCFSIYTGNDYDNTNRDSSAKATQRLVSPLCLLGCCGDNWKSECECVRSANNSNSEIINAKDKHLSKHETRKCFLSEKQKPDNQRKAFVRDHLSKGRTSR